MCALFRYIQKRRMLEEQEKAKRLEDERYEQHLRERYLKVLHNFIPLLCRIGFPAS